MQGRQYPTDLHCIPCPEILEALKLPPNSITKLKRACYGLVDAPLEWWRSVDDFLVSLGLQRSWADACTWMYRDGANELKGLILFAGGEEDVGWQAIIKAVEERFRWADWERDTEGFVQCGVKILTTEEEFTLWQEQYVENLQEIPISSMRRKNRGDETNDREKTQLRALLGALSWHAQQVAPHIAAEVGLLLSEVSQSSSRRISS